MVKIIIRNFRNASWRRYRIGLEAILATAIFVLSVSLLALYFCAENIYCQDRLIAWGNQPWYALPSF